MRPNTAISLRSAALSATVFAAAALMPSLAAGVTLNAGVTYFGRTAQDDVFQGSLTENTFIPNTDSALGTELSFTNEVTNGDAVARVDTLASIDATTGELKVLAESRASGTYNEINPQGAVIVQRASSSALASAMLGIPLILNGTGTLTALFAVDLTGELIPLAPNASGNFNASVNINIQSAATLDFGGVNQPFPDNIDIVNEIMSVSVDYVDVVDQPVTLNFRLIAEIGTAVTGILDASNTGRAFFTTSDGLIATPVTAGVLSNPAFTDSPSSTVVPLPGTLPLILGAFGMLVFARRRKSSSAA